MSADGKQIETKDSVIELSAALDNTAREHSSGSYKFKNTSPESGIQPTLAPQGITTVDFVLPKDAPFNLHRSYLNFNVQLPNVAGTATARIQSLHSGFLACIQGITLKSGYATLIDMDNIPEWTKVAWRSHTAMDDFMTFPCHSNEATVAAVTEPGHFFNRIRDVTGKGFAITDYPNTSYHVSNEAGTAQAAASDSYTAVANSISSPVITAAASAGALSARVQLPLKLFYGTLLSLDRDMYLPADTRLTIRFNNGLKWGFLSSVTGGVSPIDPAVASTDLTENPTISSVQLRVAIENNPTIAKGIMEKVNEQGTRMVVPYTYVNKFLGSAAANDTSQITKTYNDIQGRRLLRVVAGIFSNNQTGARYCNNYNLGANKWVSYRTWLGTNAIQDEFLQMSDMSAYQYHAERLKGSVIKDFKDWAQCPSLIEDFSGFRYSKDYVKKDHYNTGRDLTKEAVEFNLQFVNGSGIAAGLNVYLFAVCQREITVKGIDVQIK